MSLKLGTDNDYLVDCELNDLNLNSCIYLNLIDYHYVNKKLLWGCIVSITIWFIEKSIKINCIFEVDLFNFCDQEQ